jgi:hypothetical protein
MKGWHQNCAADISKECSEKVLNKFTKISVSKLQDCYNGSEIRMSGAPEGQNDNTMLEAEMEKLKGSHEMTFPALYINGQRFEVFFFVGNGLMDFRAMSSQPRFLSKVATLLISSRRPAPRYSWSMMDST